ncbi:hypothetical protein N665_0383s0119 [Sinapis alba]|nr:hypothetical protein N665_0383s0119 [Sinapis alba]
MQLCFLIFLVEITFLQAMEVMVKILNQSLSTKSFLNICKIFLDKSIYFQLKIYLLQKKTLRFLHVFLGV